MELSRRIKTSQLGGNANAVLAWYNHPQLKAVDEIRDRGKPPPTYERWTDDDERELLDASKTNITVDNTALGWVQMKKKQDFDKRIQTMMKAEWEAAVAKRESIDSMTNLDANDLSNGAVGEV